MNRAPDWETVESIVGRAEGLAPEERVAFLDEACAGDAALRAEVESLLERLETSAEFFDRLEACARDLRAEVESAPAPERIGPFEIEEEIGRGGMGVVYRARDARLGRRVALKLLPPWTAAVPEARERMVEEARAVSALDHPNIGALHDVVDEAGRVALVLAYYEGETLAARLARGPVPPAEAVEIARQIARGLAAAHEKGIVHRDLKPSNVMLGDDGRTRILDFGVAKIAGSEITREGARLGTAAYMSPEQIRGDPVDARADLWAVGVLLHEMVAGRRPFPGTAESAVMRAILEDDPPPPDPPGGSCPAGIAATIERLLAKDPARRHAGAAGLVRDLEAIAAGELPRPPGRRRARRRAAAAAAMVLAIAAGAVTWWGAGDRPGPPAGETAAPAPVVDRVAILPFDIRGDPSLAYLREGVPSLLAVVLDGADGVGAVDPNAVLSRVGDAVGPAEAAALAGELGASRWVLGSVVEVDGQLRIRASLYDRSGGLEPVAHVSVEGAVARLFNLVDEVAIALMLVGREGPGEDLVQVAALTTGSIDAFKLYLDGDRAYRDGRFLDAVEAFRAATERDSLFALAWYRLSVAAGWIQLYESQTEAAETAFRLADRLPALERGLLEAERAWPRGDVDRAEALYRRILTEHPESADAWFGLGEVMMHANSIRGRSFVGAREPFERAIGLYGHDHQESLIHLADLAAWEGRHADYDSLYARLNPAGDLAIVYAAQKTYATGTPDERRRIVDRLRGAPPARIRHAAGRTAPFARNPAGGLEIARLLLDSRHDREWRAIGHLMVATMEVSLGRWSRARVELDRAAALAPGPALLRRGWLAAHPLVGAPREEIEEIRSALVAWRPEREPVPGNPVLAADRDLYPQLRDYLVGLLSIRMGDVDEARRRAAALSRAEDPPEARGLSADLVRELEARVAVREGRPDEALEILASTRLGRPYSRTVRSAFFQQGLARWLRAELLLETGELERALDWYRSLPQHYFDSAVFEAPAAMREAEILERLGRHEQAAAARSRVDRVWRDADPEIARAAGWGERPAGGSR